MTRIAELHSFASVGSLGLSSGSLDPVILYFVSAIAVAFGALMLILATRIGGGR